MHLIISKKIQIRVIIMRMNADRRIVFVSIGAPEALSSVVHWREIRRD